MPNNLRILLSHLVARVDDFDLLARDADRSTFLI